MSIKTAWRDFRHFLWDYGFYSGPDVGPWKFSLNPLVVMRKRHIDLVYAYLHIEQELIEKSNG